VTACDSCGARLGRRNRSGLCRRCHGSATGAANRRHPDATCEHCGRGFRFRPGAHERFCSRACYLAGNVVPTGPEHPSWVGDEAAPNTRYRRAQRLIPRADCEVCGAHNADRHHRNGDTSDNRAENIARLCRLCHTKHHAGTLGAVV